MSDPARNEDPRERRALEMLRSGNRVAETTTPGEYLVASQSGKGLYRVRGIGIEGAQESCECLDFRDREVRCKHIRVVLLWLKAATTVGTIEFPKPHPRRTPVDQVARDQAQANEERLFPALLHDLVGDIPEPTREQGLPGRKPIPVRDLLYCAIFRTYRRVSCRLSSSPLAEAAERSMIGRAPFWDVGSKALCNPHLTPILRDLVPQSLLPLRETVERVAIDSTGFRTTRFNYYRNEKYTPSRRNIWLKGHIVVDIPTHGIVGGIVTGGDVGDTTKFAELLQRAVDFGFPIKEVCADKAYLSRKNCDSAETLHITPYIPLKSNCTGEARGSPEYRRLARLFLYRREEFDAHYRNRVQVEAAIGSVKQRFEETVASRNIVAQENEILSKMVAHNLTVLVQAMYAVGEIPKTLLDRATPPSPSASADHTIGPSSDHLPQGRGRRPNLARIAGPARHSHDSTRTRQSTFPTWRPVRRHCLSFVPPSDLSSSRPLDED